MLLDILNLLSPLLLHFAQPLLVFLHKIDFLGLLLINLRLVFFDRVCDKQTRARLFRLWLWLLGCFSGIWVEWGKLSDFLRVFFLWPGEDWWQHGTTMGVFVCVFWGGERVPAATVGLGLRASYL